MNGQQGVSPLYARAGWTLLGATMLVGITGCGTAWGPGGQADTSCMPPHFTISPASAPAGSEVVIAAPSALCNPAYGAQAEIELEITDATGARILHTTAPMKDDGEFSYRYTIDAKAAPGVAQVVAYPHELDWCDDTGENNRLKGQSEIQRTSCVIPTRELLVEDARTDTSQ